MRNSVLVVEDEAPIREGLVDRFHREGFDARGAEDGEAGATALGERRGDLVVLDLMLPGISGEDLLVGMRERGDRTPVLVLSARGREPDRVLLLSLGADDYLAKPFSVRELVARVRAILRRTSGEPAPATARIGDAVVDLAGHTIARGGESWPITATERGMLSLLLRREGQVVGREEFLREVWGYDRIPETRTVDFHIVRLRRKIEHDPEHPVHLETVRGAGYRLSVAGGGP